MELTTQIVILATALVGLYKAATFHKSKEVSSESREGKTSNAFVDLFDLLGMFLFMLAFPAFLFAFMWIMSSLPKAISNSSEKVEVPNIKITKDSSQSELMLFAALNISNSHTQGKELKKVIEYSLSKQNYQVALSAASSIGNSHTKDQELAKVIKFISNSKKLISSKVSPNKQINKD